MIRTALDTFDRVVVWLMDTVGIKFARLAVGIVFIWFGALKVVGDLSPAYDLVAATVYWLTPEIIVPLLGLWEVAIGVAFLIPKLTRLALILRSKAIGASLDEIKHYLDLYGADGEGRVQQLKFVLERTDQAITELQVKRAHIEASLAELRVINATVRKQLESK